MDCKYLPYLTHNILLTLNVSCKHHAQPSHISMQMSANTENVSKSLHICCVACVHMASDDGQWHMASSKSCTHGCGMWVLARDVIQWHAVSPKEWMHKRVKCAPAKQHRLTPWSISEGLHAHIVLCAYRLGELRCLLSVSIRQHCMWPVKIRQATSDNGRKQHPMYERINRGIYALSQQNQSWPARTRKVILTNCTNHKPMTARSSRGMWALTRRHRSLSYIYQPRDFIQWEGEPDNVFTYMMWFVLIYQV